MLPVETNIRDAYANGQDAEQQFIQDLALFFCTYLKEHGGLIEKQQQLGDCLLKALHYLLLISEVEEVEIFKICLEYWNALCSDLYRESPFSSTSPLFMSRPSAAAAAAAGGGGSAAGGTSQRRLFYQPVLTKVRFCWPSTTSHLKGRKKTLFHENYLSCRSATS